MTDPIHLLTQQAHVVRNARGDFGCPRCLSQDIDYDESSHEGSHHQQLATCDACGLVWWDIYTLTSYELDDDWVVENTPDGDLVNYRQLKQAACSCPNP